MNEVKNITDQYHGNSQPYNAYKNILDKIFNTTLLKRHTLLVHGKDPVNRQILAQRNCYQSITYAAPRTTPISLGTFVPKADGGPRVCEIEAKWNKVTNESVFVCVLK